MKMINNHEKSIIKKKKKKQDKLVLLVKNSLEALIFKALLYSNMSHDEFVLINNVLKEYDDLEKEIHL